MLRRRSSRGPPGSPLRPTAAPLSAQLADAVAFLMREVAATAILPRWRRLAEADVEEKSPGDLVTAADREAEALIARGLSGLLPGARVVGEELAAARPEVLQGLDEGAVWLVDPLDGTGNFVEGHPAFAVMVALLRSGEAVMGWMLAPLDDTLAFAERGGGATLDGQPVRTQQHSPGVTSLRGAVLTRYMPPDVRVPVEARLDRIGSVAPSLYCAGATYPSIAGGERHFALFWRTLPWDHAPGTLFLTESGGHAARPDGTPYRPADGRTGLLAAQNRVVWDEARAALLPT